MGLRRRELLVRTGGWSLAGLVAAAVPAARVLAQSGPGPLDPDGTLQAFADTILPGRNVERTESGAAIAPGAIAGVHPLPGAVETDALALYHHPKTGFDALEPAFLADLTARAQGDFLSLDFERRTAVVLSGLSFDNESRLLWEAAAAVPFTAFCAAALSEGQTAETAAGYRVMGLPGRNLEGYKDFSYRRRLSRERTKTRKPAVAMAERVDVLIAGSGFGGSITAWRLAELYEAADADPRNVLVVERGRRFKDHTDFEQSMHIDHLSDVYMLIQGDGAQIVVGNGVGGGSNLYLAASLRSPTETFERRDRRPGDGDDRRMWPSEISRATLNPYYERAEKALRVQRPTWNQVSKSGGLWAKTLAAAGHTCDRVPLAITESRCANVKWCHTGCVFGAKNTVTTNYLASAERAGVRVRPNLEVQSIRQSTARPYRYVVTAQPLDDATKQPEGAPIEIEAKVVVLSMGAMANAPILMRSKPLLPSLSEQLGRDVGVNGDHIAAIEYDPKRVQDVLGLPGYSDFFRGKPITTMTYDFWVGRRGNRWDGTRFNLQEIFLSSLTNFLYDDGREPAEPSWWGLQKKEAVNRWANRIELLAMVEDTHDGQFYAAPHSGSAERPNAGPVAIGTFTYKFSEQSVRVREAADLAMKRIAERKGLGRFMKLTETQGAYASHPLGGCRMATDPGLGVTDHRGAVFGYEGLYAIDSSIIPTSLGVNPSLTIAAVSERCAEHLVASGGDLGLPARPQGFAPRTPDEILTERLRKAA